MENGRIKTVNISTNAVARESARGILLFLPDSYCEEDVTINLSPDDVSFIGNRRMLVRFALCKRYKLEWDEFDDYGEKGAHQIDYLYGGDVADIFEGGSDEYAHLTPETIAPVRVCARKELLDD